MGIPNLDHDLSNQLAVIVVGSQTRRVGVSGQQHGHLACLHQQVRMSGVTDREEDIAVGVVGGPGLAGVQVTDLDALAAALHILHIGVTGVRLEAALALPF